ncbi:BamA/TamA family outer membrane protein [Flavisolibacter ginsenosidimutans]|uniref:BamA/TamA family outer membrane protein n=1 Tax=Flavisolibacter ginsenosidimutans TaxID=661481 RepID=A0A5B8UM47_9BACT|nr:BamA/TamA family outer membrane protein [Flavisolibacter ginsenosidimutans]QEC57751.1 BamA/TamA family outer membrane protein [Flavisolibacter ginsenosidimutans]
MAKVKYRSIVFLFLTVLCVRVAGQGYAVTYIADDSAQLARQNLARQFANRFDANTYVAGLLPLLRARGFVTASLDSVRLDSSAATVVLFFGEQYKWGLIRTAKADAPLLEAVRFPTMKGLMDFSVLGGWQKRILDYLEETGRPFGKTYLDSLEMANGEVSALLRIDEGPLYKIDSLQVFGDAKVNADFLYKYLDLPPGTLYDRRKLLAVNKKLSELSYVEEENPAQLSMLPTGAVLNLYLKAKRSSQVNALVGFLPNSEQATGQRKFQLTVDANVLLKNALGNGETIGLLWQQLQKGSPRLNLLYEQPYIFKSPFGATFSLDMYKRDSFFLNLNMNLGVNYRLGEKQTASVFLQRRQSIVNGIDAAAIVQTKQLPLEADVSSFNLGIGYDFNNTDYRYNPRKGSQLLVNASAGTKNIKKNNLILELQDPSDPSFKFESLYDTVKLKAYQFRITAAGAQYVQLGKQTTLKLGGNFGVYQSANVFRNELFMIGGNRLLRGFDEESQFVSQYGVGTVEFRLLTGLNSNFFAFADGGWGKYPLEKIRSHTYISTGVGLSFQPKAGLINVTWAVGKRDDSNLNLRQSKIHIGFVSFF